MVSFVFINFLIVKSDIHTKKIPNKYLAFLLILLPFWWILLWFWITPISHQIWDINLLYIPLQLLISLIVSFFFYYFGVWAAGDAKYLLVLSLFLPYENILSFLWNIALITIVYLLAYFVYFYFWKVLLHPKYRKSLTKSIKEDITFSWKDYHSNKWGNTYKIIIKLLLGFLIIFVSLRLLRTHIIEYITSSTLYAKWPLIDMLIANYWLYLLFVCIWLFIWFLYVFKFILHRLKHSIAEKSNIAVETIGNILLSILAMLLIIFLGYELHRDYSSTLLMLYKIFTLYLGIYLCIKILLYSYKITFGIGEHQYTDMRSLKVGDIIDNKDFQTKVLPNIEHDDTLLQYYDIEYKRKIDLSSESLQNIQRVVRFINKRDMKFFWWWSIIKWFITIKTFSFWIYIFVWFLLTFFYWNSIINSLLWFVFVFIKYILY